MALPDLIARLRFEFHDQGSAKAAAAVKNFESGAKSAGAATTGLEKSTTASHDKIVAANTKSGTASERLATTTTGASGRAGAATTGLERSTTASHDRISSSLARSGTAVEHHASTTSASLGKATAAHESFGKSAASSSALATAAAGKTSASFEKLAGTLAGRMGPASGVASSSLSKVTAMMGGMSPVAMGAVAGVAALAAGFLLLAAKGVTAFVSLTAEVRKFKAQAGGTAEDASKMVAVFRSLGIESETGSKAMGKLALAVAHNSKELNKYGVDVAFAKNGTVDMKETTLRVGDAYQHTADKSQQAGLMAAAYGGKLGKELIPMLGKTREEIKKIWEEAANRGEIFSQKELDAGKEFSAAVRHVELAVQSLALSAGRELVPNITGVVKAFMNLVDAANKLGVLKLMGFSIAATLLPVKLGIEAITKVVEFLGSVAGPVFDKIGSALGGLGHFLGITHEKSKEAAKSQKDLGESEKEVTARAKEEKEVLDKLVATLMSAVNSSLSAEGAWNSFADALVAANEAAKTGTAGSKEQRDAMLSVKQAAVSAADAEVKLASDQADANSVTLEAADKAHIYREALVKAAAQASGPTRAAIQSVIDRLDAMPGSKEVTVGAHTDQANQKVDETKGKVEGLPDKKHIQVTADTEHAESGLQRVLGLLGGFVGDVVTTLGGDGGKVGRRASGGPVQRNKPYVVGEDGPELFVPDLSGVIVPSAATRRGGAPFGPSGGAPFGPSAAPAAVSGGGGGNVTHHYEIHPPAGTDSATVAAMVGREMVWRSRR